MKSKGDFMEQLHVSLCPNGDSRPSCVTSPSSVRIAVECGQGLLPKAGDKINLACRGSRVMYAVKGAEIVGVSTTNMTRIVLTLSPLMYYFENSK